MTQKTLFVDRFFFIDFLLILLTYFLLWSTGSLTSFCIRTLMTSPEKLFKIKLTLFLYNRPNSGYGRRVVNPQRFISAPEYGSGYTRDPDPDQDSDRASIFWAKNLEIVKNTLYSILSKIRINQLVSHLKEQSKERFCMQLKQRNK